MTVAEVRKKYLDFMRSKGHAIIPSASLVPDNDPTTLFTGSGMQPIVPYLLGEDYPAGARIANSQKCFRAEDLDEIGDNRHTTFFEMLGNWSFGDYFKEEQLLWYFTFLTDELRIEPERLYVTVFGGDSVLGLPRDEESVKIWKRLFAAKRIHAREVEFQSHERAAVLGMQGGRIFFYGAEKNWWSRSGPPARMPAGEPGGADSEVFYEFPDVPHDEKHGAECHPNCDCGRYLEIGNSVFMEYRKRSDGGFDKLARRNVDFGGGLERMTAVSENRSDIFTSDAFSRAVAVLESLSRKSYGDAALTRSFRVIADHVRAVIFLLGDSALPSNTDRGYLVRRLIRRAVRNMSLLGLNSGLDALAEDYIEGYQGTYPELTMNRGFILSQIREEEERFRKSLDKGSTRFQKIADEVRATGRSEVSADDAFDLYQSYGFPIDVTMELSRDRGLQVDRDGFNILFKRHQDSSRAGSDKKFKGGLAGTSIAEIRYHTATHLLQAALREVLGTHVHQEGSNITPKRLRFDFSHSSKMSDAEKERVEAIVNAYIARGLPVEMAEVTIGEAKRAGALGVFHERYLSMVRVYRIGEQGHYVSQEICGGPHVRNTSELGHFAIVKEEGVSQGVRRIRAVLT